MWEKIYILYQSQEIECYITSNATGAYKFGSHSDMLLLNKISTSVVKSLKKNTQKKISIEVKM